MTSIRRNGDIKTRRVYDSNERDIKEITLDESKKIVLKTVTTKPPKPGIVPLGDQHASIVINAENHCLEPTSQGVPRTDQSSICLNAQNICVQPGTYVDLSSPPGEPYTTLDLTNIILIGGSFGGGATGSRGNRVTRSDRFEWE